MAIPLAAARFSPAAEVGPLLRRQRNDGVFFSDGGVLSSGGSGVPSSDGGKVLFCDTTVGISPLAVVALGCARWPSPIPRGIGRRTFLACNAMTIQTLEFGPFHFQF